MFATGANSFSFGYRFNTEGTETNHSPGTFGGPAPAATGGLFGQSPNSTAAGGLFGAQPATGTFGQQSTGFSTETNHSPGTFGGPAPAATGGLFGQSPNSTAAGGLFGAQPATGTFGQQSTGFNATASGNTGGLFGQSLTGGQTRGLFSTPSTGKTTSSDWQCDKNLQDCVKYMFDTETAADVTFLVGENKEIVRAHKFILISRSPVFYAMFEGLLSEKGDVTVPDITKTVFVEFLRYLYTDEANLDGHNIVEVMYAAKKYCVDRLTAACNEYIKKSLTAEKVCDILEQAHAAAEESLVSDCRKIIFESPTECLESSGFTSLCKSCVISITDADELAATEEVVFNAVMRWSEAECERQDLEVTDVNRRQVLGDVIYTVRFPVMDDNVFFKEVIKHDLLSPEEFLSIGRVKQGLLRSESIRYKCRARSQSIQIGNMNIRPLPNTKKVDRKTRR